MEREDIEKAAKNYSIGKTHFRRSVLKEVDADDYVLRKSNCREDFIAGADWRINSVWHKVEELPKLNTWFLAQIGNDCFDTFTMRVDTDRWKRWCKGMNIIRWAYIEDLLPNSED